MKNPFMPGDRVVCIADGFTLVSGDITSSLTPQKGEVLIVDRVLADLLSFEKYNLIGVTNWFDHPSFAPAQDATEMEFEEIEFAHYQEMTA